MNSYINIEARSARTKLYRVFSYERLVQLFESRTNVLVRPKLWDDPLENYVLDAAHRMLAAKKGSNSKMAETILNVKEHLYGQCWSATSESDAMWRIYSANKAGVRVKTSISKLFKSVTSSTEVKDLDCFIGKVKYEKEHKLFSKLSNPNWLMGEIGDSRQQAASLFFKRNAFVHENEYRLVVLNVNTSDQNLFSYSIDPHTLIEEVVLDPRMSRELVSVFTEHLKKKLKFKGRVEQSTLYRVPNLESWRAA